MPAKTESCSVTLTRTRAPMAAKGGERPPLVDGPPFQPARNIAEGFDDIGRSELDSVFLKWIRQQTEALLLDRAFSCVWIGRLVVVGLLVLLRDSGPQKGHHRKKSKEPS